MFSLRIFSMEKLENIDLQQNWNIWNVKSNWQKTFISIQVLLFLLFSVLVVSMGKVAANWERGENFLCTDRDRGRLRLRGEGPLQEELPHMFRGKIIPEGLDGQMVRIVQKPDINTSLISWSWKGKSNTILTFTDYIKWMIRQKNPLRFKTAW